MNKRADRKSIFFIYLVLTLATLVAYEPLRHNDFVGYDDNIYVTQNSHVKNGLAPDSVVWAFTKPLSSNWHLLTVLSHMLDCQLFGLNPLWHHMTNLLFHIANTLLLFLILKKMTGAIWCSGFVAAAFALHPLHVESVAWVAERKDVLSSFFWMLTIAAYIRYVERPAVGRYVLVFLAFALGLMAKPMLVTLPFVLLLLDYWPLNRFSLIKRYRERNVRQLSLQRLIAEKIPLFLLAGVSSAITYVVQQSTGAMVAIERTPLNHRIFNTLVSYIHYLVKMIYPIDLAVLYPHPGKSMAMWQPIVCFVVLGVILLVVIYFGRRHRYLVVGWLWYLGTLVPVIGLVQVGRQAMADRYTYLPSIGIFIMVAWGANVLLAKYQLRKIVLGVSAGVVLTIWLICARVQVSYWQDSLTLYEHALSVTKNNYTMYYNYGYELEKQGIIEESILNYKEAIRIAPYYSKALSNLGGQLCKQGKLNEAVKYLERTLQINPNHAKAHNNLGVVFVRQGKYDEAIVHYQQAIKADPNNAKLYYNLGKAFQVQKKFDKAIVHFKEALRIEPGHLEAMVDLGHLMVHKGKFDKAIPYLTEALRIRPDQVKTQYSLGCAHAGKGNHDEAIEHFREAVMLDPNYAPAHYTLGKVLSGKGMFAEAIRHFKEALCLKADWIEPMNDLAWFLATSKSSELRNTAEAIRLGERACELTKYKDAYPLDTLAAAYAAAGRFSEAIGTAQKALELAKSLKQDYLIGEIKSRLVLYKSGQPYIEP